MKGSTMQAPPPPSPSLREFDFNHFLKHYIRLFWRWKLWIILAGPCVAFGAALYLIKFAGANPTHKATVSIGLENVQGMTAVMDLGGFDIRRTELLRTRPFLEDIAQKLSLRLGIKDYRREDLFDSLKVDSLAKLGKYEFNISDENAELYVVTFTNKRLGLNKKVIESGKISSLKILHLPGIYFHFSSNFISNPHNFTFAITSLRKTIENILSDLTIENPNIRRQIFYINVTLKGKDNVLIAKILNTMADAFIERNASSKKRKSAKVLEALSVQLKKSKAELEKTESRLRNFRFANPTVGLNQGAQQTVQSLIDLETNAFSVNSTLNSARKLQSKYIAAFQEDKEQIAQEILVFLITNNNTSAPIHQANLSRLIAEKRSLEREFVSDHPNLKDNQEEINKLLRKVYSDFLLHINNVESQVKEKASTIQNLSTKLKRLPAKELQLTELQRAQNVASEIYSQVLNKYNQAKVAQSVETADVFILDYAVPPLIPPTNLMKALAMSLILGLGAAFGLPIAMDMINKTVRTEYELQKVTDLVVLESIPKIIPIKRR